MAGFKLFLLLQLEEIIGLTVKSAQRHNIFLSLQKLFYQTLGQAGALMQFK